MIEDNNCNRFIKNNSKYKALTQKELKDNFYLNCIGDMNIIDNITENLKVLQKCKNDEVVQFRGDKIYAQYFGKVYTFLYNAIPVTVRFDGSVQEFPKFIYDKIMEKIHEVSESNTPKVQIEDRTEQ